MLTLNDLQRRLEIVRAKERSVILVTGVSRSVAVLIGSVLAYFLLDWLFDPPILGRWIAALGLLGYFGYTLRKHLLQPLRKIHDDDEIALRIEARHPVLHGRLISTVQLTRAQNKGQFAGSPELLQALEEDTLEQAAPLDFLKVINKDVMVKFLAVAAAVVLIKAAMLVQFPDYFAALAERLIDPNQQFPTKVRIREVQAPERVARGDAVPVAVFLDESSELPEAPGTLVFHTLQEGTDIPVELVADADGAYRGALAKALEDMRVMAKLGDGQSEWVDVKVLPRPEVQDGTIRFKPPEYAKLEQSAPEKFGGMTALLGSSAEIEIQTNKPLTACVLKRMDERDFPLVKTDAEGKAWRLAEPMPIDKSTSFYMDLTDQDGLKNSQPPVVYPINAKPDQQPLIKLRKPTRDKTVTPRARIDVVFDVRDDYGVRTVWLCFRIQHESEATEGVGQSRRYELPLPEKLKGQRNIGELPFNWDLEALNLKVGDQVIFWLEADDDCASNNIPPTRARGDKDEPAKPQEEEFPRSADVKLSVISKEDKIAELQALVARLYEQVRGLNDRQKELKDELMKLIEGAQNEIKKESN